MKTVHYLIFLFGLIAISCKKTPEKTTKIDDQFYLRNDQSDMPVFVKGNATTNVFILVLSGGPGNGGLVYRGHTYSDLLEEKYAMVYWDQRHQGNSHGHLTETDFTVSKMVEDTYLLTQVLKERYGNDISLFIMGHSWGGLLGTAFMVESNYQNQVKGWIEVDGAHDFPMMNVEMVKMMKTVGQAELDAGHHPEKWAEMIAYANGLDTNNITTEQASQLNGYAYQMESYIDLPTSKSESNLGAMELLFFGPDNPAVVGSNRAQLPESLYNEILNTSLTDQLHKIHTPTLLLWGKYDFAVPKSLGESAFNAINTPEKTLKIYEESGHSPMRYQPKPFVADVINFVEKYK